MGSKKNTGKERDRKTARNEEEVKDTERDKENSEEQESTAQICAWKVGQQETPIPNGRKGTIRFI